MARMPKPSGRSTMVSREMLIGATERLQSSLQDPNLLNNWAQVRSKHLLDAVAPEVAARIDYTYSTPRLKRVATSALHTALLVLKADPQILRELSDSLRIAAEVMEYLADLPDETRHVTTRIIAAGLYQLAGYEANSMCIARALPLTPLPRPGGIPRLADILDRWTLLALRRQLLRLRVETETFTDNREHWEQRWIEGADEGDSGERLVDLAAALVAADMYGSLALAALQGPAAEDSFRRASEELSELLSTSGRALELLEARTLQGVGELVIQNGVWNQIPRLVQAEPAWERYATLSARGTAANMLDATSRIELWESQRQALSAGLLDAQSGFSIRMPTSAGKTRIAELAIVNMLVMEGDRKALYVAPFRALADEVEESLTPILADLGLRVSSVLGGFEVDELEAQIIGSADLIVTTPEKLALLTRIRPELLRDIGLIVLDEGHVIEDRDRGVGYELLLTKLRHHILPESKILFVSAVISSSNAADFAEWLCADRNALIESEWRPARQLIGIYNAQRDRISYPLETAVAGAPAPFVLGAATPHEYLDYTEKLRREKQVQFPKRTKGEVVAELAINFAKQGPVLVFTTSRGNAESVAQMIQRGLRLRRQTTDAEIPAAFNIAKDRPGRAAIEVASLWLGEESSMTSLLAEGIGVHHAGLPEAVRKAVEADCRGGSLPVVVATTTLAQGVNLPVKTVIVHSTIRHVDDDGDGSGGMEEINPRELWNIIGRAGRAARETEGHVVLAAMDDRQDRQYDRLLRREIPPIRGQLYSLLEELTDQRLSDDRFRQLLDSELITLMVEESVGKSAETLFQELVGESFVRIQTGSEELLEPLHVKGAETIGAIRGEVPSEETRKVFARTGLDVRSCLTLRDRIVERKDLVQEIIFDHDTTLQDIITTLVPDIVDLPQMETGYEFPGDLIDLADDWLGQLAMPEIVKRHLAEGADQRKFHRFVADLFGFRLPWGIGAYTAIADHVLDTDREVSEVVRWLPTMFRYGVRTPSASWAMTLGCPSRELSVALAAGFITDAANDRATYSAFVTWFSFLTEEDFTYRFGASAHESEILSRRSASLVPSDRSITASLRARIGRLTTSVTGIKYENRTALLVGVMSGSAVRLVRDYANQYDPNAIKVQIGDGLLGYVPRTEARLLAPRMDAGAAAAATVVGVDRELSNPQLRIEVIVESNQSSSG